MTKLILSFCFFGFITSAYGDAPASGDSMADGKSADVECDVCHEKEARNIAWPEGAPFKIQEDAKARGRQVQKTAEDTHGETPVTN